MDNINDIIKSYVDEFKSDIELEIYMDLSFYKDRCINSIENYIDNSTAIDRFKIFKSCFPNSKITDIPDYKKECAKILCKDMDEKYNTYSEKFFEKKCTILKIEDTYFFEKLQIMLDNKNKGITKAIDIAEVIVLPNNAYSSQF